MCNLCKGWLTVKFIFNVELTSFLPVLSIQSLNFHLPDQPAPVVTCTLIGWNVLRYESPFEYQFSSECCVGFWGGKIRLRGLEKKSTLVATTTTQAAFPQDRFVIMIVTLLKASSCTKPYSSGIRRSLIMDIEYSMYSIFTWYNSLPADLPFKNRFESFAL